MQTPISTTLAGKHDVASVAWTVEALRSVWQHQHGRVNDRLGVIERAIAALAEDRLDTDLRRDAERAAHMLAGSIGMFGFIHASESARDLELALAHPAPDRAPALSALLEEIQSEVKQPVVLLSSGHSRSAPASPR